MGETERERFGAGKMRWWWSKRGGRKISWLGMHERKLDISGKGYDRYVWARAVVSRG